jgi:hypothetical protein
MNLHRTMRPEPIHTQNKIIVYQVEQTDGCAEVVEAGIRTDLYSSMMEIW